MSGATRPHSAITENPFPFHLVDNCVRLIFLSCAQTLYSYSPLCLLDPRGMFYESVRLYDIRSRSIIGATDHTALITESRISFVDTTIIREAFLVLRNTVVCLHCASLQWDYCLVFGRSKKDAGVLHLAIKASIISSSSRHDSRSGGSSAKSL